MELISIIVPIFNVEKYLNQCIESIVNQTYKHLEIILVDDGSTDNSPQMCDAWKERDDRIKVVHKKNGGLSDARNTGLVMVHGNYIGFVDGDDCINPLMYEIMIKTMSDSKGEIVCCQYQEFVEGQEISVVSENRKYKTLSRIEAMDALIKNTDIKQVVWNKLYDRRVLQDIWFPINKQHEDEFWSYQVIGNTKGVAVTDYVGYNYLQRKDSIMGVQYSMKRLDAIEAKVRRQKYIEEQMPELVETGKINLLFSCLYQGQLALKNLPFDKKREIFKYLRSVYKKYPLSFKEIKKLSSNHKVWVLLAKYCLVFTCRLRNMCNVGM